LITIGGGREGTIQRSLDYNGLPRVRNSRIINNNAAVAKTRALLREDNDGLGILRNSLLHYVCHTVLSITHVVALVPIYYHTLCFQSRMF
jgi:hypothetical protein